MSAPMMMEKIFTSEALPPINKDKALQVISKMALDPVSDEDIYIGRALLANDQIDRSYERFPVEYLERFAETLPRRPVLSGHNKSEPPIGRWFDAAVEKQVDGSHALIADFYLDAKSDVARRVQMGIAKDLSIGLIAAGRSCDLCGKAYLGDCDHQVGHFYEGKQCTLTYGGDLKRVEAIEGSFVGVGCQYGAQTIGTKSFLPGSGVILGGEHAATARGINESEDGMEKAELEARVKVLEDENAALKKDVEAGGASKALLEAGKAYHDDLRAEIAKNLGILKEESGPTVKLLAAADLETLKEYNAGLLDRIDKTLGAAPVSKQLGEGAAPAPAPEGQQPAARRDNPFFAQARSS